MQTLPIHRHETFALALAEGFAPEFAYRHAGFPANNAKARAHHLARSPAIAERVGYLKATLPRIHSLQDRHAPSCLLQPETPEQMQTWLWQIAAGARHVTSLQFRAATHFSRIKGWHLVKTNPFSQQHNPFGHQQFNSKPAHLGDHERTCLASLVSDTIAADLDQKPLPPATAEAFLSAMADAFLAPIGPEPTLEDLEALAATYRALGAEENAAICTQLINSLTHPQPEEAATKAAEAPPIPKTSPSQLADPQPTTTPNPQTATNYKSPQTTPADPQQPSQTTPEKRRIGPSGYRPVLLRTIIPPPPPPVTASAPQKTPPPKSPPSKPHPEAAPPAKSPPSKPHPEAAPPPQTTPPPQPKRAPHFDPFKVYPPGTLRERWTSRLPTPPPAKP